MITPTDPALIWGKESEEYYWYGAADGNLDYYLIAGESMPEVLGNYTYLTGTVPVPQKWTLGYHSAAGAICLKMKSGKS